MNEILVWYGALPVVFKVVVWVLIIILGLSLFKRIVKLAILVFVLLVLIFALRAFTLI